MSETKPVFAKPAAISGFCTKYALTQGVYAVEVYRHTPGEKYVYITAGWRLQLIEGKTFFLTEAEALANAAMQARKKLKAVDRAKAKLEAAIIYGRYGIDK